MVADLKSYKEMLHDLMLGVATDYCGYPTAYTVFNAIEVKKKRDDAYCQITKLIIVE